jgi:hypothetical protein
MNIYPSNKPMPYVYIVTHKITGKFYIGYRESNTIPSHIDLPKYKTSSKIVKPAFDQYQWKIIAEFFNGNDAYDFEQQLIFEHWDHPLIINRNVRFQCKRFKSKKGRIGAMRGRAVAMDPITRESLGAISTSDPRWETGEIVFIHTGKKQSKETIEIRLKNTDREKLKSRRGVCGHLHPNFGKKLELDHCKKLSNSLKNKKKPVGFGKGTKNGNYGKRHPGLNSGSKNSMFGKTGAQHHNFGKRMPVTEQRFRGKLDLYLKIIECLKMNQSIQEINKQTNVSIDVIRRIKSKKHSIWQYISNHENKFKK